MKTKKIPYYLLLTLLTVGASLILGFLSFGGMYALMPLLPLAFASFGLSVAYEGEIYLQNIKGAFKKLFKSDYLERYIADDYLLHNFPNTADEDCPQFFKDYEIQLNLLNKFNHKNLDKESLARKGKIEKTMKDMRKWFTLQLYKKPTDVDDNSSYSQYQAALQQWLASHKQQDAIAKLATRAHVFNGVKLFSVLSGLFMGFGTTYLLVEGFATIPLLATIPAATLPFAIVPMAIVAGAAYAFLTYNAVTDMINNDTLRKWYTKLRDNFTKENASKHIVRNVFLVITAVALLGLAVALTLCTAGTWWTVAKNARPLFNWMSKIPAFVMGIINPIITGVSALIFNLQNTSESLEMIDNLTRTKGNIFKKAAHSIQESFEKLRERENWLQILNPARILLKLTITPLRIVLFLGHLISIGVTSDRVPGIPEIASAILGIISEGFEDAHYFFEQGHDHHHHKHSHDDNYEHTKELLKEQLQHEEGHSHEADLPTKALKAIFAPLYLLATLWDYAASHGNSSRKNAESSRRALSFTDAWHKQTGQKLIETVELTNEEPQVSQDWQVEQANYHIERFKNTHLRKVLINTDIAQEKETGLNDLQAELKTAGPDFRLAQRVKIAASNPTFTQHRFFDTSARTETSEFLEKLADRIDSPAAPAA
ncbi:Uncharacterised protein [Legionella beliardensis]|uniref:Uncharacterized protein n=1 Tax=Legionella beliardensis TaxID=91822 RepID=A0A378HYJ2_9GAMM|nr:hypothetical protein [Legionella beliardensis]STX27601.1 Uncharacterised protein [Legionella beliardensis]